MAYVGFDLDETLGRFSVAHFAGLFLQPRQAIYESIFSGLYGSQRISEPIPYSQQLEAKLKIAFQTFADCLVEKELAVPALGLIRPSMIDFIHRLYELKQAGLVKSVLIYSNNGNPALLLLAAKMLESLAAAPGLFCDFIHWYHPLRANEVQYGRPGTATKTIHTLLKALTRPTCNPTNEIIHPENVYFFDDAVPIHYGISRFLGDRYFQIKPYKFDADPSIIVECFKKAMESSGLDKDEEYFQYIQPALGPVSNYGKLLQLVENDAITYQRKMNKPNDTQLKTQFNTVFPKRVAKANFTRSLTALRKLENKLNAGMNLSNQERVNYEKAKTIITNFETQNPEQAGGKKKFRKTKKHRKHR